MTLFIGDRVQVRITDTRLWSRDAVVSMNGKIGTVTSFSKLGSQVFVEFDTPAERWWPAQSVPKGWYFLHGELVRCESYA